MATPVEMPKPGITVEECLLVRWLKRQGESVAAGEAVAEIETDKATFEVPAPAGGTLLATFFEEGQLVPVYTAVGVIGEPGEAVEGFRPAAAPVAERKVQGPREAPVAEPAPAARAGPGGLSPRARRFAAERGLDPTGVAGSGPGGRVLEADLARLYRAAPRLSHLARKQIEEGYELPEEGTGLGGMILARDLGEPPVPVSAVRERIARRMRESLAGTAQYTLNSSAEAGGLLRLRAKVKAARIASALPDINLGEMVAFCTIRALERTPELNAEYIAGKLYRRAAVHLAFACDTPRGLLAPVVRDSQKLTLAELSLRMKTLAAQAAEGTISPDDLAGATFTVSNLGALGIESFTPILNPPQVAILGVNAIQLRPVRKGGGIEFLDFIGLSLTLDHQMIDGAPGARFLQVVKECIEKAESLCTI